MLFVPNLLNYFFYILISKKAYFESLKLLISSIIAFPFPEAFSILIDFPSTRTNGLVYLFFVFIDMQYFPSTFVSLLHHRTYVSVCQEFFD